MGIASSVRALFTAATTPIGPIEQQRLEFLARRTALQSRVGEIANKVRALQPELAELSDVIGAVSAVDAEFSNARVAAELGEQLPEPLDVLRKRRDDARRRADEAAERQRDLLAVQASWQSKVPPLHTALQDIRRELRQLVPALLDEKLLAIRERREASTAAALADLREERVLRTTFDVHSVANALGEYRNSGAFAEIRIPPFTHPAIDDRNVDDFARGKRLAAEHAAYHAEERAVQDEASTLLESLLSGS